MSAPASMVLRCVGRAMLFSCLWGCFLRGVVLGVYLGVGEIYVTRGGVWDVVL